MIKIYDINDKLLMQAEVTSAAKREQEMSKSDYISLSFSAAEKVILPIGAYINYTYKIDKVREVTRKFLLLESYEPTQSDECSWKYTPQFQHPKMILSKTPFFIYTRNSQNVEVKQNVWSFVGTTSALSEKIKDFLNKDLMFGECGWKVIFSNVTANTVNVSFSDNDFISALTAITNAIGDNCEWHIDYDDEIIYIGKVLIGATPVVLEVGKNVGVPSINNSKEGYYNAFSIFGGTRNITQVNSKGENVSSGDIRLQLDEGNGTILIDGKERSYSIDKYSTLDLRADKTKEPLFTKVLDFSQIYPSLNTYVYNVRGRVKYVLDDNNKKIPISYNADGSVKEYKTFTVWYMKLAYPATEKVEGKTIINTTVDDGVTHYWYDFEVTDDLLINGKNIGCSFEPNFNTGALSTPLAGRGSNGEYVGFELIYHKEASSSHTSDDVSDSNFSVLAGDYEIIYQEDNEVIIPTNEAEMLIPRGESKPSLKCNITVLYNIAMADTIYYEDAQNRLLEKAKEEIVRLLSDLNNYEVKSYSDVFLEDNPQLQIGQSITYKDGHGYELATRVLKLSTNIDYDFIQSITIGNQVIKGTITQLKEDVQTIIASGGSSGNGGGYSVSQLRKLIAKYGSDNFISKQFDDIAKGTITWEKLQKFLKGMKVGANGDWTLDELDNTHLTTDYLQVRMKAIFETLEILHTDTLGGELFITPVGSNRILKVEEVNITYDGVSQKAYRCYFLGEQDGSKVENKWKVGDQARSKSFNLTAGKYHNVGNHYYWRLVIGVSSEAVEIDGKKYHYVDLSDIDKDAASDEPMVDDILNQCGNRTNITRQSCLVFSAVDTYSPCITLYHGVDGYTFNNKEYVNYGVNHSTNKAFFHVYGDMYFGDRPTSANNYEGESYVKFDSETKKVTIKGELDIKSTYDGKTLDKYIADKRRIFGSQPVPPYDVNDMWVNATYPSDGSTYKNEILKCSTAKAEGEKFDIADWKLASKYTDDTKAEEAKKAAEKAQEEIKTTQSNLNTLGTTVSNNKKAFDDFTSDGYLDSSEIAAIAQDSKRLEDDYNAAVESYNNVVGSKFLLDKDGNETTYKTDLVSAKATLDSAKNELITYLSDIVSRYNASDSNGKATIKAAAAQKYTNFTNAYKAFYDKLGVANNYITSNLFDGLNTKLITNMAGLEYIKAALVDGDTVVKGGLILSTLIALRNDKGNVTAGINGADTKENGIALWLGGKAIDKQASTTTEEEKKIAAKSLLRFDGTGYFANGNLWWDADGILHADPTSFIINKNNVGVQLALFAPIWKSGTTDTTKLANVLSIDPQKPFTHLDVSGNVTTEGSLKIGGIYLSYDSANNALRLSKDAAGKEAANFYALGGITAYGKGAGTTGGGGLNASVISYARIIKGDYTDADLTSIPNAYAIKALSSRIDNIATELGGLNLSWNNITGKPSTFTPSAHTHKWTEITDRITKVSQLTNDKGYLTAHQSLASYYTKAEIDAKGYTTNKGTVTSVGLTLPTGLTCATKTITTSGTFAISLASGYSIPTTAKQTAWDGAVSAKHTHSNKSVLDGITSTKVTCWDSAYDWYALITTDEETADGVINKWNEVVSFLANIAQTDTLSGIVDGINKSISDEVTRAKKAEGVNASGISTNKTSITTLQGYFTSGSAKKALQLTNTRKLWGNSFNGTADINGSIIVPDGKYISIGNIKMEYDATNKALKITNTTTNEVANLYTSGGVSAYGVGTSSSSGGGLNGSVKSYSNALKLTSESLSEIASAYSIKALDSRISSLEGGSATSIETTGSGNAVTSVSKSGTKITFTKGSTFSLNGHTHDFITVGANQTITATQYTNSRLSVRPYYNSGGPTIYGNILEVVSGNSGGGQLGMEWSGSQTKTDGTDTNVGKLYYRSKRDNKAGWTVWKRLAFAEELAWGNISGKPTSLSGYGITDGVNAVSVTGSGNAVTAASVSGHTLTLTKGATYLTSHQSLSNYYTKSSVDSLLNGKSATSHTHSVKINGVTKTIAATGGTAVDLGTYLTSHQSLADYAKKSEIPTKVSQLTNDTGYITSSGSCAYATSAGNADKVDGYHESSFLRYRGEYGDASVTKDGVGVYGWAHTNEGHNNFHESYGDIINIQGFSTWRTRFDIGTSGRIRIMHGINTTTATQVGYLAYLHDNVASATKLRTPRTIWGQSFDGTGNVNGTIYINNSDSENGAIILNNNVNANARISAIKDQVVFNTGAAIRFGATNWEYSDWAGLKYDTVANAIYLGIADGTVFNYYSNKRSNGTLKFPGITTITPDSGARIGGSGGDLYLGNGNNTNWVKVQDICSQAGSTYWQISQSGNASFKSLNVNNAISCGSITINGDTRINGSTTINSLLTAKAIKATTADVNAFGTSLNNWDGSIAANVTNMFNGIPMGNIQVEYSMDNGATWNAYPGSPENVFNLVNDNVNANNYYLGLNNIIGNTDADKLVQIKKNQLRVTVKIPAEIYQELSWISVDVNNGVNIKCQVYYGNSNGVYTERVSKIMYGWSHKCDICVGQIDAGVGNDSHRYVRFVFSHPSNNTNLRNGIVAKIRALALTKFARNTDRYTISTTGHIYDYDAYMNTYFPNSILAKGGVTAYQSSDIRLKQDLRKLDYLGIIKAMGGTYGFAWKKDNTRSIGWIAQHVLCNPHLKDIVETDEKGYYKINYWSPKLIATAFGAIEQVGDEVSRLKARVVFLESEVQRLSGDKEDCNKKRLDNKNINSLN